VWLNQPRKTAPESPNILIDGAEANENSAEAMELSGADESSNQFYWPENGPETGLMAGFSPIL